MISILMKIKCHHDVPNYNIGVGDIKVQKSQLLLLVSVTLIVKIFIPHCI
jgi:hypothetical protein